MNTKSVSELTENDIKKILFELADKMHPHLAGDNHTREMIEKAFSPQRLTTSEAFDCGKYYQRMLYMCNADNSTGNYFHAILKFKWACYNVH